MRLDEEAAATAAHEAEHPAAFAAGAHSDRAADRVGRGALAARILAILRPACRSAPWLALALTTAGCGGPSAASLMATAPEYEPVGQTKCAVTKSDRRPLVIEWPSADRAALEALAKRGLVAVRYEGCEMELLAQCRVAGAYRYTPTTIKQETVTIRNVDDLYAKVPLGAAGLEAKLAHAGQLVVAMTVVGRYDADDEATDGARLDGMCSRATHVITGLTAGSFEFYAGGAAEVGAGVDVAGVGAGARSEASRELLNRDGNPDSCQAGTTEDAAPPEGCGALLRVEVAPLGVVTGRSAPVLATGEPNAESASTGGQSTAGGGQTVGARAGGGIPAGPGIVKVHLAGEDSGLQLYGTGVSKLQPLADGTFWSVGESTILCTAPCDEYVDARVGQSLYVEGPATPPSPPFQLFDQSGDVTLEVESGDSALGVAGAVFSTVGFLAILVGAPILIVGAVGDRDSAANRDKYDTLTLAGGLVAGGGALLFGAGVPMAVVGTTSVEITPSTP